MWWLFLAPVGGLINRVRGGLFGDYIRKVWPGYGVQCARALFGLATAGFACLLAPELADSAGIVFKGARPVIGIAGDDVGFLFGLFGGLSPVALIMPLWAWLAIAVHLGLVMGWFGAADVGRDRDRSRLVEGLIMTGRGFLLTGPAGALLWHLGYGPWFLGSGAALGLLYELAHRTALNLPNLHRGMEVGEVYTGAWLWLSLGLVLSLT